MNIFGKIVGKSEEEKKQDPEIVENQIISEEAVKNEPVKNEENSVANPVVSQPAQTIQPEPEEKTTVSSQSSQPAPAPQPMTPSISPQINTAQPVRPAMSPHPITSNVPSQATPAQPVQPAQTNNVAQVNPAQTNRPVQPSATVIPPALSQVSANRDSSFPPIVNLGNINDGKFSDVYITPDKKTYIWGGKTNAGLQEVSFDDFENFYNQISEAYDGVPSYLLKYNGRNYRVERTIATEGHQFCARKMPTDIPNLKSLGLQQGVYNHLLTLANCGGMILLAGATGSGKSTTIASLLKEYLCTAGGYAFTIEDPVELPLDGIYVTPAKEIGLCKQTIPPNGIWAEGIKSALRSKPRYIYLGEIRSPDIASEALRAATSGHLVLSSIHANNVSEAVNSLIKYAASSGISESMAYELVAGGLLGVVHQILSGAPKRAHVTTLFANPDVNAGCQVRGMIRNGKLNIATIMEQQRILLDMGKPLFK